MNGNKFIPETALKFLAASTLRPFDKLRAQGSGPAAVIPLKNRL